MTDTDKAIDTSPYNDEEIARTKELNDKFGWNDKATERPWHWPRHHCEVVVYGANKEPVALVLHISYEGKDSTLMPNQEDNAELIVKAVNSYDDMVEALKTIKAKHKSHDTGDDMWAQDHYQAGVNSCADIATETLKKAGIE